MSNYSVYAVARVPFAVLDAYRCGPHPYQIVPLLMALKLDRVFLNRMKC